MVCHATQVLQDAGVAIPAIVAVTAHVVFAEWIEGTPAEARPLSELWPALAEYQGRIHRAPLPAAEASSGGMLHVEWLLGRLLRWGRLHRPERELTEVCQRIRALEPPHLQTTIVAPDFIASNIIVRNGKLVLVDNEFLGIGKGFQFDVLNTLRIVLRNAPELHTKYLAAYGGHSEIGTLETNFSYWDIVFTAKVAGKHFALARRREGLSALLELNRKLDAYAHKRVA